MNTQIFSTRIFVAHDLVMDDVCLYNGVTVHVLLYSFFSLLVIIKKR